MSLFDRNNLSEKKKVHGGSGLSLPSKNSFFLCKVGQKLEETVGPVIMDTTRTFVSMGDWSTHDLLFYFLLHTGPAQVYFSTWAISEFAVRQLYNYVNSGLITSLSGIFDYRNGIHKPAELQFLSRITANIKAAKCHAKVLAILNESWGIATVGSANFTRNPRIEAGVVIYSFEAANFHKSWILNELNNTSDFERDN